jgi:hypothetical protein
LFDSLAARRTGIDLFFEVGRAAVDLGANNDMGRKNGKNDLRRKE